jgi:hypothetical protein
MEKKARGTKSECSNREVVRERKRAKKAYRGKRR